PANAGDEAVGVDAAQDLTRFGIHLVDLAAPVFPDPERGLRPGHSRVTALTGRGDRAEDAARLRIDRLNSIVGELVQVAAIVGRAGMSGDVDRAHRLAAAGFERAQAIAGGEPD